MKRLRPQPPRMRGFTLVEMAVAIVVMALLIGSILVPLATQVDQRRTADVQRTLDEIKEALVGFAAAQTSPYLPCPDTDFPPDGAENVDAGGNCVSPEGTLPWVTLGVGAVDPWNNRYRYRVTAAFARRAPATPFTLTDQGDLQVCAAPACAVADRLTVVPPSPSAPVVVILSHGPNGRGGISASGVAGVAPLAAVSADEQANTDNNAVFVSRAPRATTAAAGDEFDDIVAWLSPHILRSRLIAAGRLP